MHVFKVWAPFAQSVAVEVNGRAISMTRRDDEGWWSEEVDSATSGTDYGFQIDSGHKAYPDPRSHWQPEKASCVDNPIPPADLRISRQEAG